MRKKSLWAIVSTFYLMFSINSNIDAQRIYPGASGFGTMSRGAYAGSSTPKVLYVDNLDGGNFSTSENSGTLRWCLYQEYPRIILFLVGGVIDWAQVGGDYQQVIVNDPYCNIFGQSAPAPGITIINGYLNFQKTHDILVQHLKIRNTDSEATRGKQVSCIAGWGGNYNIVIDHCSFSWSIDQLAGFNPAHDITFSNNIFSEPLDHNTHPGVGDEYHGMFNTFMNVRKLSIINNLYAHGRLRAPYMNSGMQDIYIANNLMYNVMQYAVFLDNSLHYDTITRMNVIGNYYKPGRNLLYESQRMLVCVRDVNPLSNIFLKDNHSPYASSQTSSQMVRNEDGCIIQTDSSVVNAMGYLPFDVHKVPDYLYKSAGAFYWDRDSTDIRVIQSVKDSSGVVIDSVSQLKNTYLNLTPTFHTLILPDNIHADPDGNGFTNIEEWIANMKNKHEGIEVNNYPPVINGINGTLSMNEDQSRTILLSDLSVIDPDDTNELLSLAIVAGTNYKVNGTTVIPSANYNGTLNIELYVLDDEGLSSNHISASITVIPVNDAPETADQEFTVHKSEDLVNFIGNIQTSDPDENQTVAFLFTSGNEDGLFEIDNTTGNIYFSSLNIDFIGNAERTLNVNIADNGSPALSANAVITIHLVTNEKVYYINPDNQNDPLSNGTLQHPFTSWLQVVWEDDAHYLQKGGTSAELNDDLIIYADNVYLGTYGVEEQAKISNQTTSEYVIRSANNYGMHIQNLEIDADNAIACIYVLGSSTNEIIIENCLFTDADYGIILRDVESFHISKSSFDNTNTGISVDADYLEISYNNFSSLQTAVVINGTSSTAKIYNNDFVDNNLSINASNSEMLIYNNIFYLSATSSMAFMTNNDRFLSDHNIFYPDKSGIFRVKEITYNSLKEFQEELEQDKYSLIDNPLFKDSNSKNFEIAKGSPAIDAGVNVGLLEDMYGMTVPMGKAPDIGSFESEFQAVNIQNIVPDPNEEILVYPNPASTRVTIKISNKDNAFESVELINYAGKVAYKENFSETSSENIISLDLVDKADGVYLVKANFKGGKTIIQKLSILK